MEKPKTPEKTVYFLRTFYPKKEIYHINLTSAKIIIKR
jgi:hypothetical protein